MVKRRIGVSSVYATVEAHCYTPSYKMTKDRPLSFLEYLEMAKKISPQNVEVIFYLGLSYDKIDKKEEAREFLSRVIELAPQSEFAQEAEKELKKINKD